MYALGTMTRLLLACLSLILLLGRDASAQVFHGCGVCSPGCPFACPRGGGNDRPDPKDPKDAPNDPAPSRPAPDPERRNYDRNAILYDKTLERTRNMPPEKAFKEWYAFWQKTGWRSGLYFAAESARQAGDLDTAQRLYEDLTAERTQGGFADDGKSACIPNHNIGKGYDTGFFPKVCAWSKEGLTKVRKARLDRGAALQSQRRYAEAEAAFREAIAKGDESAWAYADLSSALEQQGRHEEAWETSAEACKRTQQGCGRNIDTPVNHWRYTLFVLRRLARAQAGDWSTSLSECNSGLQVAVEAGDEWLPQGYEPQLRLQIAKTYKAMGDKTWAEYYAGLVLLRERPAGQASAEAQRIIDELNGASEGFHWPNPCDAYEWDPSTRDLSTMTCRRRQPVDPHSNEWVCDPQTGVCWRVYGGDDARNHCQWKNPDGRITETKCPWQQ